MKKITILTLAISLSLALLCVNAQAKLMIRLEKQVIEIKLVTENGRIETSAGDEFFTSNTKVLEEVKKNQGNPITILFFRMGEKKTITSVNPEKP